MLAILMPPLAVPLKKGAVKDLISDIILCLLVWLRGILHVLWVVFKERNADAKVAPGCVRSFDQHNPLESGRQ